jgi:hypothetical protein
MLPSAWSVKVKRIGVAVGVKVSVGVLVGNGVKVDVGVGVRVKVGVGVGVGVGARSNGRELHEIVRTVSKIIARLNLVNPFLTILTSTWKRAYPLQQKILWGNPH